MASNFTWNAKSGVWDLAANWTNNTQPGSGLYPGASDIATLAGPSYFTNTADLIEGPAQAATLTATGNLGFTGTANFGLLNAGSFGTLFIQPGAVVTAGSAAMSDTMVINGPGAALDVTSTNFSGGGYAYVLDGGSIALGGITGNPGAGFYVDATSTAEIGGGGLATAGTLMIDAGVVVNASANFLSPVLLQGTLGGNTELESAPVSGTGTITIHSGDFLTDTGSSIAAGISIVFAGNNAVFAMRSNTAVVQASFAGVIAATISGFAVGDTIDTTADITALAVGQSTTTQTTLDLLANGTIDQTLTLSGNYAGQSFLFLARPNDAGAIELAPTPISPPTTAASNTGSDAYAWNATSGGSWNTAANWQDTTNASLSGTAAPGSGNAVSITNSGTSGAIINGNGNAASLALTGQEALAGSFNLGAVALGAGGVSGINGSLDVLGGATLLASALSLAGVLQVEGHAIIAGQVTATTAGNGDYIEAFGSGLIQAAGLVLFRGTIEVDSVSAVEIGSAGSPVLGALNIDANSTAAVNQSFIIADLVNNGTLAAGTQNPLTANNLYYYDVITGDVSGSGLITLGQSEDLALTGLVAASQTIEDLGNGSTLDVAFAMASQITVSNLVVSDTISVSAAETGARMTSTGPGSATITLTNAGGTTLRQIAASGALAGNAVVMVASPSGFRPGLSSYESGLFENIDENSLVLAGGTLQAGALPTAAAGSASGQSFSEVTLGGSWDNAATWGAALAPGSLDTVTLGQAGLPTILSGAGNAALVTETNTDILSGVFNFGSLAIGIAANASNGGWLDVTAASSLTVANATVAAGTLEAVGSGAVINVTSLLSLGTTSSSVFYESDVFAAGGASIQMGGIALIASPNFNTLQFSVDSTATIEIGTAGGAAAGALTVDAGMTLANSSASNVAAFTILGNVVNNGVIGNASKNEIVIAGAVSGTGTLVASVDLTVYGQVGSGQTIDMTGTASIVTLLAGPGAGPVISGFSAGQKISVLGPVTSVSYASTGAGTGVLNLFDAGVAAGSLTLLGDYAGQSFLVDPSNAIQGKLFFNATQASNIILAAPCFASGTRITTHRGEIAVEHLVVGDLVHARHAGWTPIIWIGHRHVGCDRHPDPRAVWPILIEAHAFGPSEPSRDLWVSPDHAIATQGVLIPASCLVNGTSIRQTPVSSVTYWHVELEAHDIILAENLPVESYLENANRHDFDGGSAITLHPQFTGTFESPCAPVVRQGPLLEQALAALPKTPRPLAARR